MGLGRLRWVAVCYGEAVKAWLGLVRCVMVCRGGFGELRLDKEGLVS